MNPIETPRIPDYETCAQLAILDECIHFRFLDAHSLIPSLRRGFLERPGTGEIRLSPNVCPGKPVVLRGIVFVNNENDRLVLLDQFLELAPQIVAEIEAERAAKNLKTDPKDLGTVVDALEKERATASREAVAR